MFNARRLTPLLIVVVLTLGASPAGAAVGDSATGSGSTQPGEAFSFSVVGTSGPFDPNSATGVMTYTGPTPQHGLVNLTATAFCLVVEGNRAAIRGTVTASPTNPNFLGANIRFYVEDNGTPGTGQDRFVGPIDTQDFGCPPLAPAGSGLPLTAGEILVSGACENPKEHKDPDKDQCKDKKDKDKK